MVRQNLFATAAFLATTSCNLRSLYDEAIQMSDSAESDTLAAFTTLPYALPHFASALRREAPVKIVAMGSSSTAGRWDVVPYPARLEVYLRQTFATPWIDVVNRGRSGEEAPKEVARFDTDIFAEAPSLVIWQVGTNAVFHNQNLDTVAASIAEGLALLGDKPMDVLLMDPQYVTAMLLDDKADASDRMVSLIAGAAARANVSVFRRWALMRHWHVHNNISFERMIDPTDGEAKLHQSDWSTQRTSIALRDAIVGAAARAAA
jgi:hypothetical protein